MGAFAAPIVPGKVEAWKAWTGELGGPRKAEFAASNARHQLTRHDAWLQNNPDGSQVVIVVQDGPGAEKYLMSVAESDDPFDQWFVASVADIHGMDLSGPLPPPNEKFI